MDLNAYRDDNGADQLRMPADQCDPSADEHEPYPDQRDPYWRRRAATLAAGLGVLGLLAWAFSGGGGKPAPVSHSSPVAGALSAAPAYPSVPASGSGSPSATAGPARKSAKSAASARAAHAAANTEPGGRCSPGSVVLSLFSGSRTYPSGQHPQFGVHAVSTAPGTCTFDLSPTQLHLVVMSAGRVIWDSADCARRGGTQLSELARGIPVQEYFTWNRAITLPGCVTLASSARPGSYQAQARAPAISSRTFSFKLVR